ncbi:hypothetical protein [Ilumatobacter sp.]|uniref:hypothetical protein n=1 Tax=Ilumatobacter sp. TaxID=1967498 RepID=UPI003B530496
MIDALAPTPGGALLVVSVLLAVVGHVATSWAERRATPGRIDSEGSSGEYRSESPAVVNLLTNDATVTAAGMRATVVDLAARGWLRILPPVTDDEVSRIRPASGGYDGDALLPHERLVLQHILARFTTDQAIPARHLAVDVHGSWWRRYRNLVRAEARRAGLVSRRWTPVLLAGPVAAALLGLMAWNASRDDGTDVAVVDSLERRLISLAVLVALLVLVYRIVRHLVADDVTHTPDGIAATSRWLSVRSRLVAGGFSQMAASSVEVGDRRLAYASAMCLAQGARVELPLAREDHRRAWSAVGGSPRLVRVRYPWRPVYGTNPISALVGGLLAAFLGLRGRRFFADVARQDAWESLYDRFADQDWLIRAIATGAAALMFVPILLGLWAAFAGAADMFNTVERTGVVVRARRPAEVTPLPRSLVRRLEGDRYSLYVAVDDGSSDTITAWRATERTAMPQGADAIVRATPVLGHIRRASPIGHVLQD